MEDGGKTSGWDRKDSTHAAYVAFTKGYKSKFASGLVTVDLEVEYLTVDR